MRRLILLGAGGLALWLLLSVAAGETLLRPPRVPAPRPEMLAAAEVESFTWELEHATVNGWICTPRAGTPRGTLVMLHGLGGVRRVSDHRALVARGWRVLSVDTRGHGDSTGVVGFGWPEREEAGALLRLAEQRWPGSPLLAWGRSQGAAALLYALHERERAGDPVALCGLVLESCYADIDTAFDNRIALATGSSAWRPAAALLQRWVVARARLEPARMRPVELLPEGVPLLLARGDQDPLVNDAEWRRWLDAAPHADTVLVPRAAHVPLGGMARFDAALDRLLERCAPR